MSIQKIESAKAPAAIGPYAQGVAANGFVFLSGQTPVDPATGKMCEGTMAEQTAACLNNLQAVAEAAGAKLQNAVKVTIFLTEMSVFAEVNGEYAKFFPDVPPARCCIAVRELPKGAKIEIDAICAL